MDLLLSFAANNSLLVAGIAAVILAIVGNEILIVVRGGYRLAPTDAVRLINDQSPMVVDVRQPADYKRGHLLGALNLPFNRMDDRLTELGKSKEAPLLLYCALGGVSAQAVQKLKKEGFSNLHVIRGGINNWQAANLPVTVGEEKRKKKGKNK